ADDNASGIAGILEIAELIAKENSKRSLVVVAFDAEEMGILGSAQFVKDSVIDISAIKGMINIDMIGRLDKTSKSIMVGGSGTSPISEQICDSYKNGLVLRFSKEGLGPSDHASFYSSDVPVFFISTGAHEDYHTPEDDIDKINFDGTVRVAQFAADIALDLLNRNESLAFTEAGPKVRASSRKLKVTLGIMPDFTSKGNNGLGIAAVSKGRPAEAAGMLKGDVLTAINGMSVKNIYEYMARLKKLKPGQQITVDILRDGKTIVLIVDL
ncbi:MAG: M28 family peptidase, partial [Chlorobi bacterium]|nr:M28 family peptidase [Chlorobiota bacterium]